MTDHVMEEEPRLLTPGFLLTLGLLFIAGLAYALWGIAQVPAGELVPTHFDASGEPDAFGSRWSLLLGPGVQLFVIVLVAIIPFIEPRRGHMQMSYGPLRVLIGAMSVFFVGLTVVVTETALGREVDISQLMLIGMGTLFIVIGNLMGKIRSTFTFGVRTPWTLTSERSWVATHRLTGWLWVGIGLVAIVLGLLGLGEAGFWAFIIGIVGSLVVILPYSWWVWKEDPDKKESF
jgi:uncharacterized membrane protein